MFNPAINLEYIDLAGSEAPRIDDRPGLVILPCGNFSAVTVQALIFG